MDRRPRAAVRGEVAGRGLAPVDTRPAQAHNRGGVSGGLNAGRYQSEWMTGDPCNTATLTLLAQLTKALKSSQPSEPCFQ